MQRTTIHQYMILVGLLLFATAIHAPFHFGSVYGEQDAARLVSDSLIWLKADIRTEALSEYRYYVSPGYIWLIKNIIPVSLATSVHLAFFLNTLNFIAIIIIVIPAFFLFRKLAGTESALFGVFLLSLMPTFWLSGLYGFPHVLSLLFLLFALLLYDKLLTDSSSHKLLSLSVILFLSISILLKGDIYLSAVAMLGLIVLRKGFSWREFFKLSILGSIPVIITLGISSSLLDNSPQAVEYLKQWNDQYKPEKWRLLSFEHLMLPFKSLGFLSLPVFAISILMLIRVKKYKLASLLIIWFMIPLLFWMLRTGDSSRHHLQVAVPVALGIGLLISSLPVNKIWKYTSILSIVLVNYFFYPVSNSTLATSGNLFSSGMLIKEKASYFQGMAELYSKLDYDKKIILGSFANPYFDSEVLYMADSVSDVRRFNQFGFDSIQINYSYAGRERVSTSVRVSPKDSMAAAIAFKAAGYQVYSMEYDIKKGNGISYDITEGENADTSAFKMKILNEY